MLKEGCKGSQLPSGGCSIPQFNWAAYQVSALISSGARADFMDTELAACLGVLPIPLARTLCGTHLIRITHSTKFITLTLSGNHAEEIHFLLIHSPFALVVWHSPFAHLAGQA